MIEGEPPEAALELVAIDDRAQAIRPVRLVNRQEAEVRRPVASATALGVASANEEPVRPRVKARGVAERREITPDGEQRLLRRVLGKVEVAQPADQTGERPPRLLAKDAIDDGSGIGRRRGQPASSRIGRTSIEP